MSTNDLNPSGTTEGTTGTTANPAADGNAAPPADGNAQDVEALRKQLADLEHQKGQWLAEKTRNEQRDRELEEVKARLNATDQSRGAANPYAHVAPHVQVLREQAQYDDELGKHARATLALIQAQEMSAAEREQRIMAATELARIPETEREGVQRYWESGDYRTPEAARKAWRGDQAEKVQKQYDTDRAAWESERKAIENGRVSPNLSPRGVSATEVAQRVNGTKYNEMMRTARSDDERREIMRKYGDSADLTG